MQVRYQVFDDFCDLSNLVRWSALEAGLGRLNPNKGELGSSEYEGVGLFGHHAPMVEALQRAFGSRLYPNGMFFRGTQVDGDPSFVHTDRMFGSHTCIAYLSEHNEDFGTAFYRHKATGLERMPPFEDAVKEDWFDDMKSDTHDPDSDAWEQIDYVPGAYNRALVFDSPLFHARIPRGGIGKTEFDSRFVWVCQFMTPEALKELEGKYHV